MSDSMSSGRGRWITMLLAFYAILLLVAAVSEVGGFGWFDWMVFSR